MATRRILMAGFGGQGVMAMGQLVTYAGMLEGKHVSWLPSYGPEMRGGSANCSVIVSDEPIGAPVISTATDVIAMNGPSYEKFSKIVNPGGNLFINASLVKPEHVREDVNLYSIPVNDIAKELGNNRVANMVMLGAFLSATDTVKFESVIKAFTKVYGDKKKKLLPINEKALEEGKNTVCKGGQCVFLTDIKPEDISKNTETSTPTARKTSEYMQNRVDTYDVKDKIFHSDINIVNEALLNVREGITFYKMASKQFAGTDAEEIFKSLATQKEEHVMYLENLKEEIIDEDKVKEFVEKIKSNIPKKDEFHWDKVKAEDASLVISVLSLGMNLASRSIDFYKKALESSNNDSAKALYKELIYWEGFHYDQLKGQYELQKETWWSDQSFSRM